MYKITDHLTVDKLISVSTGFTYFVEFRQRPEEMKFRFPVKAKNDQFTACRF